MSIGLTSTVSDYLDYAYTHLHQGPPWLPVLDPAGRHRWPRRIAARLGLPVREVPPRRAAAGAPPQTAADGRDTHLVISLSGDPGFLAPARVFALAKAARLMVAGSAELAVKAAAEVPPGGCLTVSCPLALLDFGLLSRLRGEARDAYLGVLCGPDPAALSELVLKTLLYPAYPARRDMWLAAPGLPGLAAGGGPIRDGALTVYPSAVPVGELGAEPGYRRVLSFTSPEAVTAALHAPDGLRELAEVPAQVVYASDPLAPPAQPAHRRGASWLTLLDGWAGTLIASPLPKESVPAEHLLVHTLLGEGRTVGETARAVNDNLAWWGTGTPAVMVFGDPEARYAMDRTAADQLVPPPATSAVPTARSGPARCADGGDGPFVVHHPDRVEVRFRAWAPPRGQVWLDRPELLRAYRRRSLAVVPAGQHGVRPPCYVAAAEFGGALRLLVLGVRGPGSLPGREPLVLRVLTGQPDPCPDGAAQLDVESAGFAISELLAALDRYERLPLFGLEPPKLQPALGAVARALPALAHAVRNARWDLTAWGRVQEAVRRISTQYAALDGELLDQLLRLTETGQYPFAEEYGSAFRLRYSAATERPCVYCGQAVHLGLSECVLGAGGRRELVDCPGCGTVQDSDERGARLTVTGEPWLRPLVDSRLVVTVANGAAEPLDLLVSGRVVRGDAHGVSCRSKRGPVRVPPAGSVEYPLTVSADRSPPRHPVVLVVYAVARGRVSVTSRPLRWHGI